MKRLILFSAVLASSLAVAGPAPTGKLGPRSRVDFTGADVDGRVKGPTVIYVPIRRGARFKSLVRVRQNFDPELHRSVESL